MVSYRDMSGPLRDEEMSLEEAEGLARYLKDKMRNGNLTEEDRRKCIQLALRFADPERVVAVERSAAHGQSRRQIRAQRTSNSSNSSPMGSLVENSCLVEKLENSSCRSDEGWLHSPLTPLAEK
eukprot:1179707-Prorocentrum_minimum.AAC.6